MIFVKDYFKETITINSTFKGSPWPNGHDPELTQKIYNNMFTKCAFHDLVSKGVKKLENSHGFFVWKKFIFEEAGLEKKSVEMIDLEGMSRALKALAGWLVQVYDNSYSFTTTSWRDLTQIFNVKNCLIWYRDM